jgi:hypothetical protein
LTLIDGFFNEVSDDGAVVLHHWNFLFNADFARIVQRLSGSTRPYRLDGNSGTKSNPVVNGSKLLNIGVLFVPSSPQAGNVVVEGDERVEVSRHSVIAEVAADHLRKPLSLSTKLLMGNPEIRRPENGLGVAGVSWNRRNLCCGLFMPSRSVPSP